MRKSVSSVGEVGEGAALCMSGRWWVVPVRVCFADLSVGLESMLTARA
jgi:hypothetical protein